jgi:putative hemin transport protein
VENLRDFFSDSKTDSELYQRYKLLSIEQPKLRRREQAESLQVSEAALIDQQCGVTSVRLSTNFADIIKALPSLGYIMTLTRNDSAVHERKGVYSNVSVRGPMGLVISEDRKIDLRIIVSRWASGFAVQESIKDGYRYSLQFFDCAGTAIQKIYLQPSSDTPAFATLIKQFNDADSAPLSFSDLPAEPDTVDSIQVDKQALISEWQGMSNVHQFFGMLKKYQISREQAFEIVGAPLAQPVDPSQMADFLATIAQSDLSIMCFVGNYGNIQIHTGTIETVKKVGPWLNILDPEFNLHLLEENVVNAWLIKKPTVDGDVTSLELYDEKGVTIAQFFGQRNEGEAENQQWRTLVESLLVEETVV